MHNRSLLAVAALALAALVVPQLAPARMPTSAVARQPSLDVPYVPTPQSVVDRMLEIANVSGSDYVIDLGSGDGRIPITAAKRYGAKALGVEIDPERIKEANLKAQAAGVTDKVEFRQQDLFETDISKATVLTMYLLPRVNMQLRPRILTELKPGTRVVSHAFDLGDWKPDRVEKVGARTIYFWTVPSRNQRAQR
jgi:SAM-dependent methyltransferase